ncbi:hypothetical protein A0H81_02789 [Grifola frondosa]|uniref:Uncharacterized protein n=1 Tax=Grifola frondosa TaxID=5627 RepID=A0A1C7MMG4_GRIFR|nr:hypothetical protein A0H81_02789 [Grifola frondosa]
MATPQRRQRWRATQGLLSRRDPFFPPYEQKYVVVVTYTDGRLCSTSDAAKEERQKLVGEDYVELQQLLGKRINGGLLSDFWADSEVEVVQEIVGVNICHGTAGDVEVDWGGGGKEDNSE